MLNGTMKAVQKVSAKIDQSQAKVNEQINENNEQILINQSPVFGVEQCKMMCGEAKLWIFMFLNSLSDVIMVGN